MYVVEPREVYVLCWNLLLTLLIMNIWMLHLLKFLSRSKCLCSVTPVLNRNTYKFILFCYKQVWDFCVLVLWCSGADMLQTLNLFILVYLAYWFFIKKLLKGVSFRLFIACLLTGFTEVRELLHSLQPRRFQTENQVVTGGMLLLSN